VNQAELSYFIEVSLGKSTAQFMLQILRKAKSQKEKEPQISRITQRGFASLSRNQRINGNGFMTTYSGIL